MTYKGSNWTRGDLGHDPRPSDSEIKDALRDRLREGASPGEVKCYECGAAHWPPGPRDGLEDFIQHAKEAATGVLTDEQLAQLIREVVDDVIETELSDGDLTEECHKPLNEYPQEEQ